MSEGGWARKVGTPVFVILVVLIAVVWIRRGQGRRDLTAYKAQLIAQCEKLSIDEVVSPPGPANDPAYARLQWAAARLQSRSMQPGSWHFVEFLAPGEMKPLGAVTNLEGAGTNVVTWSTWEAELEVARPHLEEVRRALQAPARRSGIDYRSPFAKGPNFVQKRVAAQWLAGEALAAAHATNNAAALESLQALLSLVELHREDPTIVNQMIRVAIGGLAFDTTCTALQTPGWTEPQLAAFQAAWEQLEFLERMVDALETERAWVLAMFERSRTNGLRSAQVFGTRPSVNAQAFFQDYVLDPMWRTAWADQDQLFFLQTYQGVLEAVRAAHHHRSWQRLSRDWEEAFESIPRNPTGLDQFRHLLSLMALPTWKRTMEYVIRVETQRSLCLAALAFRRYELRHGQLPPDLAALTPGLLESAPVDYMDGQPLRYRTEPDGQWRLYSVGLNGQDDGGEPRPGQAWKRYTSIWDGRDAVWPRVADAGTAAPVIPPSDVLPLIQFEAAPLGDALGALARQIDLNLAFDPALESQLKAAVNLRLENVSASDALQALLDNSKLTAVRHGTANLLGITRR